MEPVSRRFRLASERSSLKIDNSTLSHQGRSETQAFAVTIEARDQMTIKDSELTIQSNASPKISAGTAFAMSGTTLTSGGTNLAISAVREALTIADSRIVLTSGLDLSTDTQQISVAETSIRQTGHPAAITVTSADQIMLSQLAANLESTDSLVVRSTKAIQASAVSVD